VTVLRAHQGFRKALHRIDTVWEQKVTRYRAQAHHCNHRAIKHRCTDSDEGRVIEHQVDSWLQSGLRQFHRGISLMLFLPFLISVIEILRQSGAEQAGLGPLRYHRGLLPETCCQHPRWVTPMNVATPGMLLWRTGFRSWRKINGLQF
jgi:hypothetical protein